MTSPQLVWNAFTGNFDYSGSNGGGPGDLHVARFIVGNTSDGANYATLAAAYAAAVSAGGVQTVAVQPGSYTIGTQALAANVNIVAFNADATDQNVYFLGGFTASFVGAVSISGISMETNSANILAISGSNATVVNFSDCNFTASSATAFTCSSATASINFNKCSGAAAINQTWFTFSGGALNGLYSSFNSANSNVISVFANADVNFEYCAVGVPIETTGTGSYAAEFCNLIVLNATPIQHNGSGSSFLYFSRVESGTATAITIGAGATLPVLECAIYSTNVAAISGAGTIQYGQIDFYGSLPSSAITVSTQTSLPSVMGKLALKTALAPSSGGTGITSPGAVGNLLTSDGAGNWLSSPSSGSPTATIGSLQYFANAGGDATLTALGWLKCSGQVLAQASFTALFAQVGLINPPGQYWLNQLSNTVTSLSAIAYGAGVYVATGVNGVIITSTDAKTWVKKPTPANNGGLLGAVYGTNFVATGSTGMVATSTDGNSWYTKVPTVAVAVNVGNMMIYNSLAPLFVAAGGNNYMVTSTDGINWLAANIPLVTSVNALIFANSKYVAGSSLGQIITSPDAATWTLRTASTTSSIKALTYGSVYVLGGDGGMIKTSTDAITWVSQTSGTTSSIFCLTYSGSLYVAAGIGGVLQTSTDGVTWASRTSNTTSTISSVTFGTVYVYGTGGGRIASSTDATTWTARTSGTTSSILCVIWSGSLYVFSTASGGISTSTDGTTWVAKTSGTNIDLTGLVYDGTLYHAVGNSTLVTSTDATTWTLNVQSGNAQTLNALGYGNGLYVAAGQSGSLITSTDGQTWTSRTSGTATPIQAVAYGAGVYVYVANGGTIASSTDAITWTARTSFSTQQINCITFGTLFVAAGNQGTILTSTDGTTWAEQPVLNASINLQGIAYNATSGIYTLVGGSGSIYTSTNATTWVLRSSGTTSTFQAVISSPSLFVAAGQTGIVNSSYAVYPYNTSTQFQLPNDAGLGITQETVPNFARSLYIKAA